LSEENDSLLQKIEVLQGEKAAARQELEKLKADIEWIKSVLPARKN